MSLLYNVKKCTCGRGEKGGWSTLLLLAPFGDDFGNHLSSFVHNPSASFK